MWEGQEALKWSGPCFSQGKVFGCQGTPSCHGDEKVEDAILLSTVEPEAKSSLPSSWLTNRGNKLPRH